jgi:hypothetical protein
MDIATAIKMSMIGIVDVGCSGVIGWLA